MSGRVVVGAKLSYLKDTWGYTRHVIHFYETFRSQSDFCLDKVERTFVFFYRTFIRGSQSRIIIAKGGLARYRTV